MALFIATPGQLNIQPRIDGAIAAIKKFGKGKIKTTTTATGALLPDELAKIEAYYLGHKDLKGMFAVDAGSTQAIGQVMAKYGLAKKGVKAGGYDLGPPVPEGGPGGAPGLHDRPAAVPAGLDPAPAVLLLQVLVGARGSVGHEHGHPLRDEVQREAVPHDEDSLRGQLQQAEVPGHAARAKWQQAATDAQPPRPQRAGFGRRVAGALDPSARGEHSRSSCSASSSTSRVAHGGVLRTGQRPGHRGVLGADRDHRRRRGDAPHLRRDRPLGRAGLRFLDLDLLLRDHGLGPADLARGRRRACCRAPSVGLVNGSDHRRRRRALVHHDPRDDLRAERDHAQHLGRVPGRDRRAATRSSASSAARRT